MSRQSHGLAAAAWLSIAILGPGAAIASPADGGPGGQEMISLGLRGVYFVPNHGQWGDEEVHFGLKSRGLDVAFRESSLTMHLTRQSGSTSRADASTSRACEEAVLDIERNAPLTDTRGSSSESVEYDRLTLTITFPGSNDVEPVGARPQAAKFNYFVGGEGRGVATDVPSFGAVIYENLYDGIDLHVMGSDDGVLKYECHVAPGTDYNQIRIHYDGIESLCIDEAGDLRIETSFGTLRDAAPAVWQEDVGGASRADIAARFELIDARTYQISLDGAIDPARELIIDPDVEWMTYLGGSDIEWGHGVGVDGDGNALVTGHTGSTDFEGHNNSNHSEQDAFVVKVDSSGRLQWMTYLGGMYDDNGYAIAVDGDGHALVTGFTVSSDFAGRINTHHGAGDAFVVRLDTSGQLQWMAYLGGTHHETASGIAIDGYGNALVTGTTVSVNFEGRENVHHGGRADGFIVKVNSSGELQWMAYLGGRKQDHGNGIAVDSGGNAQITGNTNSIDFEGRINAYHGGEEDAFTVKVGASGQLQWMTYLGGSKHDYGYGIAVDNAGNAIVTGETRSNDFEGRGNAYHTGLTDAFIVKIGSSGQLEWMTYLGGIGNYESANGIAVDSAGNALVTGSTSSTDFEGRINEYYGGYSDAFLLKVDRSGQREWMLYLGGSDSDIGRGIAADAIGNAMVVGRTSSPDFSGHNNEGYGNGDAFVVKVSGTGANRPQLTTNATCPTGGPIEITWGGASPNGQIALIFARDAGAFVIPNNRPCAGTVLGLGANQIQIAFQGSAGPEGSRTLNSNTGPSACGGYLQLLDLTTCGTSNVAAIE